MLQAERQGERTEIQTRRYPDITAGTCEYCGVIDKTKPDYMQYTLPHNANCPYAQRGGLGQIRCSYCPPDADPIEVIKMRKLVVHESPTNPGHLIVVCNSLNCSKAHENRFKI